jgi:hypothetical protein
MQQLTSSCLSTQNNLVSTDCIFVKFYTEDFYQYLLNQSLVSIRQKQQPVYMDTYICLWCLTAVFLDEETFQINFVEEIKIRTSCQIRFQKSYHLQNYKQYNTTSPAYGNWTQCGAKKFKIACWVIKAKVHRVMVLTEYLLFLTT